MKSTTSLIISSVLALTALGSVVPLPSKATPTATQLRFSVSPTAADPVWSTPGITFEKKGECAYSDAARPLAGWPVARPLAIGGAKAPLFNPGFPKSDGTYAPGSSDDGFNTLYYLIEPAAGARTVICRGTILANGVDVTAETPSRYVAASVQAINASGPPMVSPKLDPSKLPSANAPKPVTPSVVTVNSGKLIRHGSGRLDDHNVRADFESGLLFVANQKQINAGEPDIVYSYSYPEEPGSIKPAPGAQFAVGLTGSATPRGYAGCMNRNYDPAAPVTWAKRGLYYCLKTPEGHIAEVIITSPWQKGVDKGFPFVGVEFWVWE